MRRSIPILALLASAPVWAQTAPLRLSELRPNQGAVGTSVSLTANGAGFVSGFVGSAANIPGSTLIWRRNNQEVRLATNVVSTTTLTTTIPASLMINAPAVVDIIVENGRRVDHE